MLFSVDGYQTSTTRIKLTKVDGYIVSTVFVIKENSIPFFETIILSTNSVNSEYDSYSNHKTFCATKKEAKEMHRFAVELVRDK